jgi:hypothetical protein
VVDQLVLAVVVVALGIAAWGVVQCARDRLPPRRLLQALFALQALLLVQLLAVLVRIGGGQRPEETGAFTGYAVLTLLLLPGALALTVEERTRWASLVMAVACVTVAVVEWRLDVTWGTGAPA